MEKLKNTVFNPQWECAFAERQYSETVSYKCYKGKAKTEIYMGEKSIKALILE